MYKYIYVCIEDGDPAPRTATQMLVIVSEKNEREIQTKIHPFSCARIAGFCFFPRFSLFSLSVDDFGPAGCIESRCSLPRAFRLFGKPPLPIQIT